MYGFSIKKRIYKRQQYIKYIQSQTKYSYNVRFSAVVDGNIFNFQLYDLKSIQDLYEFEETKVVPEGFTEKQYRQH